VNSNGISPKREICNGMYQLTLESKISVKAEEWWRGSLSSTAAATYSGKGGDSEVVGCKCNPGV
jgi:hypothetical protein